MGFIFEDDTLVEPSDSLAEPQLRHPLDNSLLDVNKLLESVCTDLLVTSCTLLKCVADTDRVAFMKYGGVRCSDKKSHPIIIHNTDR